MNSATSWSVRKKRRALRRAGWVPEEIGPGTGMTAKELRKKFRVFEAKRHMTAGNAHYYQRAVPSPSRVRAREIKGQVKLSAEQQTELNGILERAGRG